MIGGAHPPLDTTLFLVTHHGPPSPWLPLPNVHDGCTSLSYYMKLTLCPILNRHKSIYQYINISIYQYITISIYHYINISIYHYINISIYQYINISILSYAINKGISIELFYSFSMHTFQMLIQNIIECL